MARSRTRSRRRFSRRLPAADWVYRPNLRLADGSIIDDLGTYDGLSGTLAPGPASANFHVLYDSHNRFGALQSLGVASAGSGLPQAARAEAHRPKIIRVMGYLIWKPSTWAVGNTQLFGCRFGIFEQDPNAGSVLVDPQYKMWGQALLGQPQLSPAVWANDRNWQHEWRFATQFNDNSAFYSHRFNFRVNRRLDPNEAYGIWMEGDSNFGSHVTINYMWWMRTLVSDEG